MIQISFKTSHTKGRKEITAHNLMDVIYTLEKYLRQIQELNFTDIEIKKIKLKITRE